MPFFIAFIIVLVILARCIRVVPQAHAYVIERLGTYQTTWEVGLHLKVPFIDSIAKKISLKEKVIDFPPQPVTVHHYSILLLIQELLLQSFSCIRVRMC